MLALLAQLAVLAEAVGRMRTEQDRAVQAAAARRAAEQIRAEHTRRLAVRSGQPGRLRSTPVATRVRVPPSSRVVVPAKAPERLGGSVDDLALNAMPQPR